MIIDGAVLTEPRCWHITKINRISPNGINNITLAQDKFDQNKDYIELDSDGNVIGQWADYYSSPVIPESQEDIKPILVHSEITYSGIKPELKVGGLYKKLTVKFFDNDQEVPYIKGSWSYTMEIDGTFKDVSDLIQESTDGCEDNQIKIKFLGDGSYINKVLIVSHITNDNLYTSSVEIGIISL